MARERSTGPHEGRLRTDLEFNTFIYDETRVHALKLVRVSTTRDTSPNLLLPPSLGPYLILPGIVIVLIGLRYYAKKAPPERTSSRWPWRILWLFSTTLVPHGPYTVVRGVVHTTFDSISMTPSTLLWSIPNFNLSFFLIFSTDWRLAGTLFITAVINVTLVLCHRFITWLMV